MMKHKCSYPSSRFMVHVLVLMLALALALVMFLFLDSSVQQNLNLRQSVLSEDDQLQLKELFARMRLQHGL